MSSKKESIQLSSDEQTQVENLLTQYQHLAQQLHEANDNLEQLNAVLADIFQAPEAVQIALLKDLGRTNNSAAADIASAINTLSPHKEIRKEARRTLIRLESSKTYPKWKAPASTHAPAVQLPVANEPRFWKGYVSQTRDEGEVNLFLIWEQGYDYHEAYIFAFTLDFWQDGIKDCLVESGTKRRFDERISQLGRGDGVLQLTSCTLAEGKRLILEALSVNQWRKTTLHESYRMQLPLINKFILHASEEITGPDSERTFITPELEPQEVVVNFIGGWSFGDYGLSYDLLSSDNPLRKEVTRDEWIEQHRAWFDEAQPARLQLGFVHEQPPQQSAIWVPSTVKRAPSNKILEVGWSLELNDTPLSGTLADMPMGTAVNKETGRHWFWTNFTLVQEHNIWRIQHLQDQGIALQGLAATELAQRIKEHEAIIDGKIRQNEQDPESIKSEEVFEELSWRLTQLLHLDDALLVHQPNDSLANRRAYEHAVLTGDPERMAIYLERIAQRFPEQKIDTLRRLGSTLAEISFRLDLPQMKERQARLQKRAEEALREVLTIEDNALNHSLFGELLMSFERDEEAQAEFETALALAKTGTDKELQASIEAGLGNIAIRRRNFADAIQHYRNVAEIDPEYTSIWFNLGFAHRQSNQMEQAEDYYLKALAQEPGDTRIHTELTALYMQRHEVAKAQALLEQGLTINPDSAFLHAIMASVLAEAGDWSQAQQHIEQTEQLEPNFELLPAIREQINKARRRV
jgi:tetratricopeptide (TPR) repeat protein